MLEYESAQSPFLRIGPIQAVMPQRPLCRVLKRSILFFTNRVHQNHGAVSIMVLGMSRRLKGAGD